MYCIKCSGLQEIDDVIARILADWFEAEASDGFVISPAYLPGSFAEFTAEVVPELQRLGLFRHAYTGATLREHLA